MVLYPRAQTAVSRFSGFKEKRALKVRREKGSREGNGEKGNEG